MAGTHGGFHESIPAVEGEMAGQETGELALEGSDQSGGCVRVDAESGCLGLLALPQLPHFQPQACQLSS